MAIFVLGVGAVFSSCSLLDSLFSSKAQICFWTDQEYTGGYVTVYVDGSVVGSLTQFFTSAPSFGQSGTLVVQEDAGSYQVSAVSADGRIVWSPQTISVTSGEQFTEFFK